MTKAGVAAALVLTFVATGCARTTNGAGGKGIAEGPLHDAIAVSVGDPTTCILIADRTTGKVVYRYGETFNCIRGLPACDRPGAMSATDALSLASNPDGRAVSCSSTPDGSRTVGWAEGRVASPSKDLVYSAVMEGDRALPGHEIASRLEGAFLKAGL